MDTMALYESDARFASNDINPLFFENCGLNGTNLQNPQFSRLVSPDPGFY